MRKILTVLLGAALLSVAALAAGPKTYQVTGPVLEIKGDVIVVQKDTDKWEIAKDAATKITGDLKVGSKVTIECTMTAKKVEVKADTAGAKAAPAKTGASGKTKG